MKPSSITFAIAPLIGAAILGWSLMDQHVPPADREQPADRDRPADPHPSAADYKVLYNVPREQAEWFHEILFDRPPAPGEYTYLATVADPPLADLDEARAVEQALYEAGMSFLKAAGRALLSDINDVLIDEAEGCRFRGGLYSLVPRDRTIEIPLMDESLYTAEYVRHIQQTVLTNWLLWRLYVVGDDRNTDVTIYPDAVRMSDGTICPPGNLDHALMTWRAEVFRQREAKLGPLRRQIQYLKQVLPAQVASATAPVTFVTAFDNYEGDHKWHLVSVLLREPIRKIRLADIPTEGVAEGMCYAVMADGELGRLRGVWDGPHRIEQFLLASDGPHRLALQDDHGERWEFEIAPDQIVTDAQLKEWEDKAAAIPGQAKNARKWGDSVHAFRKRT